MSKFNVSDIISKCEDGVKAVGTAVDTAKDVSIRPKLNASFSVKSKKNNEYYCNKNLNIDKEFSLFSIICMIAAVFAAFAIASAAVNSLCSKLGKKRNSEYVSEFSEFDV